MNKQIVTVVGLLGTLAILAVGVLVIALPMFTGARTTAAQAKNLSASNDAQQIVIDALTAQAADMSTLENDVERLRAAIPLTDQTDDLLELAVAAADAHGGVVESVTVGDVESFAARTSDTTDAAASSTTSEETTSEDTASEDAIDTSASADTVAFQIPVTLEVTAPDNAAALEMLDEIRTGDRAVAVTEVTLTAAEDTTTLTASVLVFTRD